MKRQQEIAYQLDLFTEQTQNVIHFFDNCEDVNGTEARKVKQVNSRRTRTSLNREFDKNVSREIFIDRTKVKNEFYSFKKK